MEAVRVRFDASLVPGADQSGWLEDGSEYEVLEVELSPSSEPLVRVMFRIEADETPALFTAPQFTVVDGSLPQGWAIEEGNGGHLTFGPARWQNWQGQYSFWEDFFSGVPEVERPAREAFEAERPQPGERAELPICSAAALRS